MRLIDADALLEAIVKNGIYTNAREINNAITNAPTIEREGWVSVPIEPTKEMIEAGRCYFKDTNEDIFQSKTHYKAMLSAAPKE